MSITLFVPPVDAAPPLPVVAALGDGAYSTDPSKRKVTEETTNDAAVHTKRLRPSPAPLSVAYQASGRESDALKPFHNFEGALALSGGHAVITGTGGETVP